MLPRLRTGTGTVVALPCIIQCQASLDSRILVIPLVGPSLWSPWQLFPLPLASLGPGVAHMHLSCSSPKAAINSCGVTIFRCLVPCVLFDSETNVFELPLASAGCVAAFRGFLWGRYWGSSASAAHAALDWSACGCWLWASAFAQSSASSTPALSTAFIGNEQGEALWRPLAGAQPHWYQFEWLSPNPEV